MARKPKVIETPGDILPAEEKPVSAKAKAAAKLMEPTPAAPAETTANGLPILERRGGWVLTPLGWSKE